MVKNVNFFIKSGCGVVKSGKSKVRIDDSVAEFIGEDKALVLDILMQTGFFKAYHFKESKKICEGVFKVVMISNGKQNIENVYQIEIA